MAEFAASSRRLPGSSSTGSILLHDLWLWLRKPRRGEIAARHHGDVLDVGCGEGLLVQRLAAASRRVVGIEPDPGAVQRAQLRLQSIDNASIEQH